MRFNRPNTIIVKKYYNKRSLSLQSILLIMFILLKVFEVIDWSWWWVLSPLWIPPAITICVILLGIAIPIFIGLCGLAITAIMSGWDWITSQLRSER